jgi:hypothetical protein
VNLGVAFRNLARTPHDGLTDGEWVAAAQRPYDPAGYAAKVDEFLAQFA